MDEGAEDEVVAEAKEVAVFEGRLVVSTAGLEYDGRAVVEVDGDTLRVREFLDER